MISYGYLYKTINKHNGKFYIGKHKGIFDVSYYGSGIVLKNAIKKYGKGNFCVQLIDYAKTKEELNEMEKKCIFHYRKKYSREKLYNMSDGGDGGATMTGRKHSIESKEKIRLSLLGQPSGMKGKHFSEEAKEKSRKSHLGKATFTGRYHIEKTKQKMRKAKLGVKRKPFTKKHRENMSKNHVGMTGRIPWNKKINEIKINV